MDLICASCLEDFTVSYKRVQKNGRDSYMVKCSLCGDYNYLDKETLSTHCTKYEVDFIDFYKEDRSFKSEQEDVERYLKDFHYI